MKKTFYCFIISLIFFSCNEKKGIDKKFYETHERITRGFLELISELKTADGTTEVNSTISKAKRLLAVSMKEANDLEKMAENKGAENYKKALADECDYILGSCTIIQVALERGEFKNNQADLVDLKGIENLNKAFSKERELFLKPTN